MTLCLVHNDTHILLGMKKRGFGQGRWNGFGGKVKAGESILEAAKREVVEEIGIRPKTIESSGVLNFTFQGQPETLEVHLFRIRDFEGQPVETDEMKPQWFTHKNIPYKEMWPDDKFWLPLFLSGKKPRGLFHFQDQDHLASYRLK